MKTAISIPDDVFEAADALAQELGVSRSELYTRAIAEYVAKLRSSDVTSRLNTLYPAEDGRLTPGIRRGQARSAKRSKW